MVPAPRTRALICLTVLAAGSCCVSSLPLVFTDNPPPHCVCHQCTAGCGHSAASRQLRQHAQATYGAASSDTLQKNLTSCSCKSPPKGEPNCIAGAWGSDCEKTCPSAQRCATQGCSERYGSCSHAPRGQAACRPGYWGPADVHDEGYYACDQACSSLGTHCAVTASCGASYGDCAAPAKGHAWCAVGWYGRHNHAYQDYTFCDQACPTSRHCSKPACGTTHGECLAPAHSANSTQAICEPGWWGGHNYAYQWYITCDQRCKPEWHCRSKSCHPSYGYCERPPDGNGSVCEAGWYGTSTVHMETHTTCHKACPSHCKGNTCDGGGHCSSCQGPWNGSVCVVPNMDRQTLKKLSDKLLETVLEKLAEDSPRSFQCVYDAYKFATSFNGGVEASNQASKNSNNQDRLATMFEQLQASHESAAAILDALKGCSDQLPPSTMATLKHGEAVTAKVSSMTPDGFRAYFQKLNAKQAAALGTMAAGFRKLRYISPTVDISALAESVAEFMAAGALI